LKATPHPLQFTSRATPIAGAVFALEELSGVMQAPLTSAVILMETTRGPSLVGPLMLATLAARWSSGFLMRDSIHHVLARNWLRPRRS